MKENIVIFFIFAIMAVSVGAVLWLSGTGLIRMTESAGTISATPNGTEKQARAYWQPEVQRMSCLELKKIIDSEPSWGDPPFNTPPDIEVVENVKRTFSTWEYMDRELVFPSPRGRECIDELGYPKNAVGYCEHSKRYYCAAYNFTRSDEVDRWFRDDNPQLKTMWFPKDWFYTDPFTMEIYTEPNEFLQKYRPDLAYYNGVIRND